MTPDATVALRARGVDRALDCVAHGVKLVISGHNFDEAGARVAEHGEVPD